MTDRERLERRLGAVERTISDSDQALDTLTAAGDLAERVEELETALEQAEDRIAELEAATQALRGYVGNVRSVNEDVERRADAAVAAVDRLEGRLGDRDDGHSAVGHRPRRAGRSTERAPRSDGNPTSSDSSPSECDDGDDSVLARLRTRL